MPPSSQAARRRALILAYVAANPATGLRALARGVGLSTNMAAYHAGMLKRRHELVEHRHNRRRLFFLPGADGTPTATLLAAVPELVQLRAYIAREGKPIQTHILNHAATAWSWPRATTQHRLHQLTRLGGVVRLDDMRRYVRYEVTA